MIMKVLAHGLDGSRRDFYIKEDMGTPGRMFIGSPPVASITPDQARQLADALHDFADILEN